MDTPGSNPNIPETATLTFREQWNKNNPGSKQIVAYLPGRGNSKLVVFPHREWNPTLEVAIECVLYPVRNAAIAAPIKGIDESERVIQGPQILPLKRKMSKEEVQDIYSSLEAIYNSMDKSLQELGELLDNMSRDIEEEKEEEEDENA